MTAYCISSLSGSLLLVTVKFYININLNLSSAYHLLRTFTDTDVSTRFLV